MTKKIYAGWLVDVAGEGYGELGISVSPDHDGVSLIEMIQSDMYKYGEYLSVRYFLSDQARTGEELEQDFMETVFGKAKADYCRRYSDYTGYLWTDQELNVGGHDLFRELNDSKGKYIHLEIEYNKTSKKRN